MKDKMKKLWKQRYSIERMLLPLFRSKKYLREVRKQIEKNGGLGWNLKRQRQDDA